MLNHARVIGTALILVSAITALMHPAAVRPAWADELDDDAAAALRSLYEGSPAARVLGEKAVGILVFPNIVKAGFLFGAQFGEGTLFQGGRKVANYRSVAGSYGFQAGVQTFGYAMFLMTNAAVEYLDTSGGWEVGVGPSIVVVDAGRRQEPHDDHDPERRLRLRLRPERTDGWCRNPGLEDHEGQSLTR